MIVTERLRELLDERGIEYTCNDRDEDIYNDRQLETSWSDGRFNYHLVEFFNGESPVTTQFSMGCKYGMTAEQAIAATVGDKPKADITGLHATVNAAITGIVRNARCFSDYRTATEHINDNGDVTAIHECVKRAATVGAGTLTAEQVRECSKGVYFEGYSDGATHRANGINETDWQAIADKLNATLGAGTCHIEECEHKREIPYDLPDYDGYGGWYTEVTYDCDECGYENTDPSISFCGGCGRRVVSE